MKDKYRYAHIACIDRSFTAAEWFDWIKIHSCSEIIFQYKDFGFNDLDVCLTPHITKIYEGKSGSSWAIRTAQSPNGRWTEGNTTGLGSSPVMFCTDAARGYDTEREAIYAGLLSVEAQVKSRIEWYEHAIKVSYDVDVLEGGSNAHYRSSLKECKAVLEAIAICKDRHDPRQLTLF